MVNIQKDKNIEDTYSRFLFTIIGHGFIADDLGKDTSFYVYCNKNNSGIERWNPIQLLHNYLDSTSIQQKKAVVQVLARLGNEESSKKLQENMFYDNLEVRAEIWKALIQINKRYNIDPNFPKDKNKLIWIKEIEDNSYLLQYLKMVF
ncbi:MAG: HEAT repeat domain-containing protein [Candidatus Firestonebacteria bacterium]|nr:HEAT repeat domain-containing protein [Candidatus Firestonebacteria bacterium]